MLRNNLFIFQKLLFSFLLMVNVACGRQLNLPLMRSGEDSIIVSIRSAMTKKNDHLAKTQYVSTKQTYDLKNQYPYYKTVDEDENKLQNFELIINHFPKKGVLTIFIVDVMNTPINLGVISLDSIKERTLAIPYPSQIKNSAFRGKEYLCIWYSMREINGYPKLITGLELTMGNFITRCLSLLGSNLITPNMSWSLLENQTGLIFKTSIFEKSGGVISLIIEREIKPAVDR